MRKQFITTMNKSNQSTSNTERGGAETTPHQLVASTNDGPSGLQVTGNQEGRQGTIGDSALPKDVSTEPSEQIPEVEMVIIPFPDTAWLCPLCPNSMFGTLTNMKDHCEKIHKFTTVKYQCTMCDKIFQKAHGASCHQPKCPNKNKPRETLGDTSQDIFTCTLCPFRCKSSIGLGQHIRHAHPILANEKRIQSVELDMERKRAERRLQGKSTQNKPWSREDIERLAFLNEEANRSGVRKINEYISTRLTEYSSEQIKYQRRKLGLKSVPAKSREITSKKKPEAESPSISNVGKGAESNITGETEHLPKASRENNVWIENTDAITNVDTTAPECIPVNANTNVEGTRPMREDSNIDLNYFLTNSVPWEQENSRCIIDCSDVSSLTHLSAAQLQSVLYNNVSLNSDALFDKIIDKWQPTTTTPRLPRRQRNVEKCRGGRARKKAGVYRRTQKMFEGNKKRLVEEILTGVEDTKCSIAIETIESTYKDRFGSLSQEVNLGMYPAPVDLAKNDLLRIPICREEVINTIKGKDLKSAPGPDRITLGDIVQQPDYPEVLTNLFNIWLLTGRVPKNAKLSRSILLPKTKTGLEDVNNWRPLTISSAILRLYTSILSNRLMKAVTLNPRQRGFIPASGCVENIFLLETAIKQSKSLKRHLCVALLDLAKAFDTVSHKHLVAGLERHDVNPQWINIVQDLYSDTSTSFRVNGKNTGEIAITRGVKQGDPLSPLLFNIALDPIFCLIEDQNNGFTYQGNIPIGSMAYADDSSLLTEKAAELQKNLDLFAEFGRDTGLSVNAKKSCAFMITPRNKTFLINYGKQFTINGAKIPWVMPGESTRYLGGLFDPWTGRVRISPVEQLEDWCRRVGRAALKPRQKVRILSENLLPKLLFGLTLGSPVKSTLQKVDSVARTWVKKWLHLPECTSNHFMYSATCDGGLNLPKLEVIVPRVVIKNWQKLLDSESKTREIAMVAGIEAKQHKVRHSFNLVNPKWRDNEQVKWSAQRTQGNGVCNYMTTDKQRRVQSTNMWLKNPNILREKEYTDAIRIRTNTFPTRVTANRGIRRHTAKINCRHCKAPGETICHVLCACPWTLPLRVKRHDKIVQLLVEQLKRGGFCVMEEPHYRVLGSLYKPDLVTTKGGRSWIIDPTIIWEGNDLGDRSVKANRTKAQKYDCLRDLVATQTNTVCEGAYGLVLGVRGTIPSVAEDVLRMLSLDTKEFKNRLVEWTLRMSARIMRAYAGLSKHDQIPDLPGDDQIEIDESLLDSPADTSVQDLS
ncbi:hypothetical protein CHS0354_000078 [Potamilus streckersoni]|uniref:Reverse transcriptase domain-containing protein n=1 Tax=Potamilus streckersoni TaxID=2493646 RepID=A0AAE0VW04_9BIVA|nr:hypothetical protein CHS0354_000078 [Potamilus streckersoni]